MEATMREMLEARMAGLPLPPIADEQQRRVRCLQCQDDGIVRVWHPKSMAVVHKAMKAGKEIVWEAAFYDAVAACACPRGEGSHLPTFDATKLCRLLKSTKDPVDRERLVQWLNDWRPQNYTDFGDYGGN